MIRVGVTGGMGSGKTTFCKVWEKLGAFVLYADDLAKDLMVSDIELILKVKFTFGEESYHEDGSLNRFYLAKEAFERDRVEELNKIVHPVLWKRMNEIALKKEKQGVKVFAQEAAILLQNGRPDNLDIVILLMANREERVLRSLARDNSDVKKIEERIKKQPNFEDLKPLANYVIENNGSTNELKEKAKELYYLIK